MESMSALPPWQRLLLLTMGGLIAGFVLQWGTRWRRQESTTDYMEAIALGDGNIPIRASLMKSLSALVSIASGASIGREGPLVQLAAMAASTLGRLWKSGMAQRRLLVACGAAAGIASAYNAPLTGAMFVAEVVLGTLAFETLGPLLFASVVATATVRHVFGEAALYQVEALNAGGATALPAYLAVGIAAGIVGPLFLVALRWGARLFVIAEWPVPLRLAVGGFIVGLLAAWHPQVCGNGSHLLNDLLHAPPELGLLVVYALLKLTATVTTFSSGAVGGVFTPTLFLGAALGQLCHVAVHGAFPGLAVPAGALAIVGMGAFLAATTHAPVTAILMVFEMTLDYPLVLPLMLACVVAHGISCSLNPVSIYSDSLARKAAQSSLPPWHRINIGQLVRNHQTEVMESTPFVQVVRCFSRSSITELPVLNRARQIRGIIRLHDLKNHMNSPELESLILAEDICTPPVLVLDAHDSLTVALEAFARHNGECLPVEGDGPAGREYRGLLTKTDVLLALAEQTSDTRG